MNGLSLFDCISSLYTYHSTFIMYVFFLLLPVFFNVLKIHQQHSGIRRWHQPQAVHLQMFVCVTLFNNQAMYQRNHHVTNHGPTHHVILGCLAFKTNCESFDNWFRNLLFLIFFSLLFFPQFFCSSILFVQVHILLLLRTRTQLLLNWMDISNRRTA